MSIITCVLIIYSNKIFSGVARESKGGGHFSSGCLPKECTKIRVHKKIDGFKERIEKNCDNTT